MAMFLAPYTAIADIDGSPLDAGFLFFGEYGKNPELFPVEVFWDTDFTVPAVQPIRTRNGYPVRNGSPTKVYLKTAQHSIVIKNRNGAFVLVDFHNKGWDASFVVDASGRDQHEINKLGGVDYWSDKISYPLNGEARLNNGDIVKSTVNNNNTNPNYDMTRWELVKSSKVNSILDFSPKRDGITSDTTAWDKAKAASSIIDLSFDTYKIPLFRTPANSNIINGNGAVVNVDTTNGTSVVAVQLIGGTQLSDITFENSLDANIDGSRATISNNSYLKNVGFYNFVDTDGFTNAWGLYLKNNKNIVIDSCHFGNNTQSDIAILEGCENITIINARNDVDNGVYLNIEPNNDQQVKGVSVIGGNFRKLSLIENSSLNFVIKGFNAFGAKIQSLMYRGAEANLENCEVDDIEGNWFILDGSGAQPEYLGALRISNANLSSNLLRNSDMSDYTTNAASFWNLSSNQSPATSLSRVFDKDGFYTRINPARTAVANLLTRNKQPLQGEGTLAISLSYRVINEPTVGLYDFATIRFYDASNNLLVTKRLKGARAPIGKNIGWRNDVAVFKVPENAATYDLSIDTRVGSSIDVRKVGVYYLLLNAGNGNFNSVINSNGAPMGYIPHILAVNYNVLAASTFELTLTIPGARVGMPVRDIRTNIPTGKDIHFFGEVTATDTVKIYQRNTNATTVFNQNGLLYLTVG